MTDMTWKERMRHLFPQFTNMSWNEKTFFFQQLIFTIGICILGIVLDNFQEQLSHQIIYIINIYLSLNVNIVLLTIVIYVLSIMFLLSILLFGNNSSLINILFVSMLITIGFITIMFIYFLIGLYKLK